MYQDACVISSRFRLFEFDLFFKYGGCYKIEIHVWSFYFYFYKNKNKQTNWTMYECSRILKEYNPPLIFVNTLEQETYTTYVVLTLWHLWGIAYIDNQ